MIVLKISSAARPSERMSNPGMRTLKSMKTISADKQFVLFKLFLHNPVSVGSIAPSSLALARAMTSGLRLKAGEGILELGPGTGAFTALIRRIAPAPISYLGIESEPRFVGVLRDRFPDLVFVSGRAERAGDFCTRAGMAPVKAVISGLPRVGVKDSVQDAIIENLDRLMSPGCVFRTFQYAHTYPLPASIRFRRKMCARFGPIRRSPIIFRNLPPAFVLTWTRPSSQSRACPPCRTSC